MEIVIMLAFTILRMSVEPHTGRLLLRPLQLADAEQTRRLFPQWEIVKFLNSKVPWPYPADRVLNVYRNEILPGIECGEQWHTGLFNLKEAPEQHIGVISLLRDEWDNHGLLARTSLAGQALLTEAVVAAKVTTALTSSSSRSTRAEGDR